MTNAFDFAANYGGVGEPKFETGGNGGFGFRSWVRSGGGSAGTFLGNPASVGIGGMSTESFGLYANNDFWSWSKASRDLEAPLQVGQTLSFQWGIDWDGNNGTNGNKGFNLMVGGTEVVNVNNGGTADIKFNSVNTGMGYGTNVMLWSFTYVNANTLFVAANDRDGNGVFTTNLTVPGAITAFQIYASALFDLSPSLRAKREPYYNNFSVATQAQVLNPTFASALDVPLEANAGYAAAGKQLGSLNLGFAPANGQVLTVVRNTSSMPVVGNFDGLPEGTTVIAAFGATTFSFRLSYSGGDGNDITLTCLTADASLSALSLSAGVLSPSFGKNVTAYACSVGNLTGAITMTPTAAQPNSTIQVRVNSGAYASVASGSASAPLPLNVGSNTLEVKVTASDGTTTKTHTVTVTRSAENVSLSALSAARAAPQSAETNGAVRLEAEVFTAKTDRIVGNANYGWSADTAKPGFSGTGYLEAKPLTSGPAATVAATWTAASPQVDYTINFASPGTYFVWARGYAADANSAGLYVGLNGTSPSSSRIDLATYNAWSWSNRAAGSTTPVSIVIPAAGTYTLNVWMRNSGLSLDRLLLTRNPNYSPAPDPSFWRNQNIYQIITDRFFNGDTNNDVAGLPWFDPADGGRAHGGDFKGIEQKLDYIKALGATAIWISPVVKNENGDYHGYGATDFYAVNPRMGSMSDLRRLVSEAQKRGLLVINDVVVNHGSTWVDSADAGWSAFKYAPAGYNLKYNSDGRQYAPPFDTNSIASVFGNTSLTNIFHNNGSTENWNDATQVEMGDLLGLDDFKTESSYVRDRMKEIWSYWIAEAGFDAYRIDTVKHVEMGFWNTWCPAIRSAAQAADKPNFLQFGEIFSGDNGKCGSYTGTKSGGNYKMESVLDYPLFYQVGDIFGRGTGSTGRIEDRYKALTSANYDASALDALVLNLDNHDNPRLLALPGSNVTRLEAALVFLYTSRGIPSLYYGTEQDFSFAPGDARDPSNSNYRNDPYNREDMFDGLFEQGPSLGDNFNMTSPRFKLVAKLNDLRRLYPSLRNGTHANLWANWSSPGLFAYARRLGNEEVFVVINTASTAQTIKARPTIHPAGRVLVDLLNPLNTLTVTTASDGIPTFTMPPVSSRLYVAQSQVRPLSPVVESVSPTHDASAVSPLAPLTVTFSQAMNPSTVQAAFSTAPASTGTFAWTAGNTVMTYTPSAPLAGGTLYAVRIASSAVAAGGQSLFAPFESRFTTAVSSSVGVPTVNSVSASAITDTGAALGAIITPGGAATTVSFEYGATTSYGQSTAAQVIGAANNVPATVAANLSGLLPGATYHFRVKAVNANGTTYSGNTTFTAAPASLPLQLALSPSFAAGTVNYTATVPNSVASISIAPTVADSGASVKVNGSAVLAGASSAPIPLAVGANTITVEVTAQDGSTGVYTVVVTRALAATNANLAALSVSGATFSPLFAAETLSYETSVVDAVTSVTVTPTVEESSASVKVNGVSVASGFASQAIPLTAGANTITVAVTSESGNVKTYTIKIIRGASTNANLSELSLGSVALSPTFAPLQTAYSASVANSVASVNVTAAIPGKGTIKVNGAAATSGSAAAIPLAIGSNSVAVEVTAEDGVTKKTYTIAVTRDAVSIDPIADQTYAPGATGVSVPLKLSGFQTSQVIRATAANLTSGTVQKYEAPGSRILQGLKPDVVMIQEFNVTNNTPAQIRGWLDSTFGSNFQYFRESSGAIPNGVISRYPILQSGSWEDGDATVNNREFAWAKLDIPGPRNLWVFSVHLKSGSTSAEKAQRKNQADTLVSKISANVPADDYVLIGGDCNTYSSSTNSETCLASLAAVVDVTAKPVDHLGDPDTNLGRTSPYDRVMAEPDLHALEVPVSLGDRSFAKGLVFDSRSFPALNAVSPVQIGDSGASGMQHMAVVRSFAVDAMTIRVQSSNPDLFPAGRLSVEGTGAQRSITTSPAPGQTGTAVITVNATDGAYTNSRTFKVTVRGTGANSNANLVGLAMSSGALSPALSSAITNNYTAIVPYASSTITVTPTAADEAATVKVRVNGGTYATVAAGSASVPLTLSVGNNALNVQVTSPDGTASKTYSASITRANSSNADLSSLSMNGGNLDQVFSSATTSYTSTVSVFTNSVTVTPTAVQGVNALLQVRINGGPYATVASGGTSSSLSLNVGANTIDIRVTAPDGTLKTYTLKVTRPQIVTGSTKPTISANANLSRLVPSSGTLSPEFSSATTQYAASVDYGTESITVLPDAEDVVAALVQVRINGGAYALVASGATTVPLALNVGSNVIDVKVVAESGEEKVYTLTVTRAQSSDAGLSSLNLAGGLIGPEFSPETKNYMARVRNTTPSIMLTPTAAQAAATLQVRLNGGSFVPVTNGGSSGALALQEGDNIIELRVTAPNLTTTETYTIVATRAAASTNANLGSLTLSSGALVPEFSSGVGSYAAGVLEQDANVTLTAACEDSAASVQVQVNGRGYTSAARGMLGVPVSLDPRGNTVQVRVVAEDGVTEKIYTVNVFRAVPPIAATQFSNPEPMLIPEAGPAQPYPSAISVAGLARATKLKARIGGLTHALPDDLDIFLVSPGGKVCSLMSDAGGDTGVVSLDLEFDDAATSAAPDESNLGSVAELYRPTNHGEAEDAPGGAVASSGGGRFGETTSVPAPTVGTSLQALLSGPLNGDWKLFVVNDGLDYAGSISSWSLVFEAEQTVPAVANPSAIVVAHNQATLGGNITDDGGTPVLERGFVYALKAANSDPTIGGSGVTKVAGTGSLGSFSIGTQDLTPSSEYVFKAYAINSRGTSYSSALTFNTLAAPGFSGWTVAPLLPADRRGPSHRNGPMNLPNFLSYSMGLDPRTATPADMPTLGQRGTDTMKFIFRRAKNLPDADLRIMSSTNLSAPWSAADVRSTSVIQDGGDHEKVEATVGTPQGATRFFLRLNAEQK